MAWTLALAATGAVLLGGAEPAEACSCAGVNDDEALALADAVFTGRLVEVVTPQGETYRSDDPERFVFEVDGVHKGTVSARQSIVTARDGASCGLEISGHGPFVVFARAEPDGVTTGALDGELYSNLCTGTRTLADGPIPASFGAAEPPIPGASPIGGEVTVDAEEGGAGVPTLLILAVVGLAVVLVATYVSRRGRGVRSPI